MINANSYLHSLDNSELAKMADEIVEFNEKTGILPDDAKVRNVESMVAQELTEYSSFGALSLAVRMIEREILKRFSKLINI